MKHNGQIAMEFLLLIAIAFGVILTFLIAILSFSEGNSKAKAYSEMDDLGKALQQEFLLAAQLEDGYTRKINLPVTANGEAYDVSLWLSNNTDIKYGYLLLTFESTEILYLVPPVNGTLIKGDNILIKNNGTLKIN